MTKREFHPVADIFPMMGPDDYGRLLVDIRANGFRPETPVYLHPDGRIIDGRNRYKACDELGVEPRCETWSGEGSLVSFVVALNLNRRQLDTSQRAMVAARMKPMFEDEARARQGTRTDFPAFLPGSDFGEAREKAAAVVNVSPRTVSNAAKVIDAGSVDLVRAVDSGEVPVTVAAEIATLPKKEQAKVLAQGPEAVREKAKEVKQERQEQAEREEIESAPPGKRQQMLANAARNRVVSFMVTLAGICGGLSKEWKHAAAFEVSSDEDIESWARTCAEAAKQFKALEKAFRNREELSK